MSKIITLSDDDLTRVPFIEVLYPYQEVNNKEVQNVRRLTSREVIIRVGGFRIPVYHYSLHTDDPRGKTVITMTGAPVVVGLYDVK